MFGISLKPLINNIIYKTEGEGLFLVHSSEYNKALSENNLFEIFKNQYSVPFEMGYVHGYEKGEENIRNTRTFKIGRMIISIFDFRNWKFLKH